MFIKLPNLEDYIQEKSLLQDYKYNMKIDKESGKATLNFFCDKQNFYLHLYYLILEDYKIIEKSLHDITMWSEDWTYNIVFKLKKR